MSLVCVLALSDSGALQAVPGPSFIFPALALESVISPRSSVPFYWRMILETKFWEVVMPVATGLLLLLGPTSWQCKDIPVCILTHVCIQSIHISMCNNLYLCEAKHEFMLMSPTLTITTLIILSTSPCLSIISHSNNQKSGSHPPSPIYLFKSSTA